MQGTRAKTLVDLENVLPLVAPYISHVKELAILGASSKGCNVVVKQYVAEVNGTLLIRHLQLPYFISEQWIQGMRWLVRTAGGFPPNIGSDLMGLFVPHQAKAHVLTSGFRFSYEQLVTAARQRVVGVESWVQQMLRLHLPTNMPKVVEQATSLPPGSTEIKETFLVKLLEYVVPGNIANVLHLAVNDMHRPLVAKRLLQYLSQPTTRGGHEAIQEQITPQLIQELMQTAVQRGHYSLLKYLRRFPAINHLDAAAVQQLFQYAVQNLHQRGIEELQRELEAPQFTQHLNVEVVGQLLVSAVKRGITATVLFVSSLDKVKQIGSQVLEEVMELAVSGNLVNSDTVDIVEILLKLPAAQQLSSSCVTSCLASVILRYQANFKPQHYSSPWIPAAKPSLKSLKVMKAMMDLNPVQSLPAAALEELLDLAVAVKHTKAVLLLLRLPSAAELGATAVYRLLQKSLLHPSPNYDDRDDIHALLFLPAVASFPATAAVDLMHRAIDYGSGCCIELLCSNLPELDAADLLQVIKTAASRANMEDQASILLDLLRGPAATHFTVQQLMELLCLVSRQAAVDGDSAGAGLREVMTAICRLPAAQQQGAYFQMLWFAMSEQRQHLARSLLDLPAAKLLSATEVGELLNEAVKRLLEQVVVKLCDLPSASAVSPHVLFEAVLMGMDLKLGSRTMHREGTARLCPDPSRKALNKLCSLWAVSISQNSTTYEDEAQQSLQSLPPSEEQQTVAIAAALDPPKQPHLPDRNSSSLIQQQQQQQQPEGMSAQPVELEPSKMLDRLSDEAIKQRCLSVIKDLLEYPATQALLAESKVKQLMLHAAEQNCVEALQALCALPAAANVAAPLVERMLCCALNQNCMITLKKLCQLPAVKTVGRQTAIQVLQQAQRVGKTAAIDLIIASIPAAMDFDGSCLVELIQVDLQVSGGAHVMQYMQAPAASPLDVHQLSDLLKAAIISAHWLLVESLCTTVPACQDITATEAESLITTCILCSRRQPEHSHGQIGTALAVLFRLKGFQQLGSKAVQALLSAAVRHAHHTVNQQLKQLPAANCSS